MALTASSASSRIESLHLALTYLLQPLMVHTLDNALLRLLAGDGQDDWLVLLPEPEEVFALNARLRLANNVAALAPQGGDFKALVGAYRQPRFIPVPMHPFGVHELKA